MAESKKKTWRFLNPDGSFNIERVEWPEGVRRPRDLYHLLLTRGWPQFLGVLGIAFLVINFIFALIYAGLGPNAVVTSDLAAGSQDFAVRLLDSFFFSVQTFATVGYGKLIPHGVMANSVMTVESFVGVLYVALVTGVFFARFSRPTARVIFSKKALIRVEDGVPSLMFRLANLRSNQIVDAQISVSLARNETTREGESYRTFQELDLEGKRSPMFVLSWTVVHPITASSPLHGLTPEDLINQEAEILIVLTGWDETFSSTIHARYSYGPEEILWNHRFVDIMCRTPELKIGLDIARIHEVEPIKSIT